MAFADREADRRARSLEFQAFEGGDDLVGGWSRAALLRLRLLPGRLEAEQRLGGVIGGVGRRHAEAVSVDLLKPAIELAVSGQKAMRTARADDHVVGKFGSQPGERGLAGGQHVRHALRERARGRLE